MMMRRKTGPREDGFLYSFFSNLKSAELPAVKNEDAPARVDRVTDGTRAPGLRIIMELRVIFPHSRPDGGQKTASGGIPPWIILRYPRMYAYL